MKSRSLLPAVALALGLTFVLLRLLDSRTPTVCADPSIYYVLEGKSDACYSPTTPSLTPDLEVVKRAALSRVEAGKRLTYTIHVTNTGDSVLHAAITDTLPISVTLAEASGGTLLLPGGNVGIVWTATISAPDHIWTQTVVVTVEADYTGPLTNVVYVTTAEDATGIYTETSTAFGPSFVHLPLVMHGYQDGLRNPGFEGIICHPSSLPGWCLDNWTHETHDGEIYDNIFTPQAWVTWWRESEDHGRPEVKTLPNVPPFTSPLARIRSGNYAVLLFTSYRRHDTGLYQVVTNLRPGATVEFSAYAHGWSCDRDEPLGYSCGDPDNQTFQVGIEPNGVADPFSPSIIWSSEQTAPDYYSLIGPVTAQVGAEGRVCVYLRSKTKWAYKFQDAYWDDASLTIQPSSSR